MFFTGSDIQANIGILNTGLTNGSTRTVTGLTFAPDLLLTAGTGFSYNASQYEGRLNFGCATKFGTIKNSTSVFRMRAGAGDGTTVSQAFYNDKCFAMYENATNNITTASVTSFNSDGFTITSAGAFTSTASQSTSQILYMAIKGPSSNIFDLQNYTSSTSTGLSGIATTDFIPSLVIGSIGTTTTTNTTTDVFTIHLSYSDGHGRHVHLDASDYLARDHIPARVRTTQTIVGQCRTKRKQTKQRRVHRLHRRVD